MTRQEQEKITEQAIETFNNAIEELRVSDAAVSKRLRTCSAHVWETKNYFILQSYNTFIACIEKETDTCYDVLRIEYGYTATSAQHISKFRHDYGSGKWGCNISIIAR